MDRQIESDRFAGRMSSEELCRVGAPGIVEAVQFSACRKAVAFLANGYRSKIFARLVKYRPGVRNLRPPLPSNW